MARVQASKAAMLRGLGFSAACGVSYGLYSPAYNIATNDPWNMAGPGTPHPESISHPAIRSFCVPVTMLNQQKCACAGPL